MIKQRRGGILLNAGLRAAGEGEKDGKSFSWDEAYIVTYVPFEDTKVLKLKVDPAMADAVDKALETVHWGAFIALEMRGKMVVGVSVEADPLAEME